MARRYGGSGGAGVGRGLSKSAKDARLRRVAAARKRAKARSNAATRESTEHMGHLGKRGYPAKRTSGYGQQENVRSARANKKRAGETAERKGQRGKLRKKAKKRTARQSIWAKVDKDSTKSVNRARRNANSKEVARSQGHNKDVKRTGKGRRKSVTASTVDKPKKKAPVKSKKAKAKKPTRSGLVVKKGAQPRKRVRVKKKNTRANNRNYGRGLR